MFQKVRGTYKEKLDPDTIGRKSIEICILEYIV